MIRKWAAAVLLGLAACNGVPAATANGESAASAARSAAGLEIVPLTIQSRGQIHRFQVEVARTAEQQSQGMMYRERLAPDRGMIFPFDPPRAASFWMKNTPNSLDLVFIGTDGRIESIAADAVPFSEENLRSLGVVASVLEIAGGRAAELGLQAGDTVNWGR
jgi:uncharacterized membrane protein (UPF0127 family)